MRPGLSPAAIQAMVETGLSQFEEAIWDDFQMVMVVLRGGALLEPALSKRFLTVMRIHARRFEGEIELRAPSKLPIGVERLLICDVLADTGQTLLTCGRWAVQAFPGARIDLLSVYASPTAISSLSPHHRTHSLEIFGAGAGALARSPAQIPYDFGEIATSCELL